MVEKFVYNFHEGNGTMKNILGGKGANLAEMISLGLPVPYGFTISTSACSDYYENKCSIRTSIMDEVFTHVARLEEESGKQLGNPNNPLLVSVRSGARASMPGMMDTILNLGLNDEVVEGLAKLTNNERFAYDSYRRFIQMFADVVMGLSKSKFEVIIDDIKAERKVKLDTELTSEDLKQMVLRFKAFYYSQLDCEFPSDPKDQLAKAVEAVFKSWNTERAIYYRKMNDIPSSWGTAVNVQMMVFGNMGETSGTGVAFTRDPGNGENQLFGEFLMNAQGEDVVAGTRTPMQISHLQSILPKIYDEFVAITKKLELHYRDMQDMEFTIENEKLFMLQTRNGKRTAKAALKIACDLVDEGILSEKEAVMMVNPNQLDALLHPTFDPKHLKQAEVIATGLAASPGAATGQIVFHAKDAIDYAAKGHRVILVRLETSPEDIEGMAASKGILTIRGGMTSHAAVVARGMGICCVSGCGDIKIDSENKFFIVQGKKYKEYDYISIDGTSGHVYGEAIKTVDAQISGEFSKFMSWADTYRKLQVRTNADTPKDAQQAVEFGAEGIGLVRTEHMFFEGERIKAIREMIVSKTLQQREHALAKLLPMQREDFVKIYEVMQSRPVTIRYLDPPLHEFLPTSSYDITTLAQDMQLASEDLIGIIQSLHEFNPMMGHRGCRLAISYPEIAKMQTRAVIEAAIQVSKEHPEYDIKPEIMIPLVGDAEELKYVKEVVCEVADALLAEHNMTLSYQVGTMIEIPRAALLADEIAVEADFFSFGTNDLTQMTFGFSRDDAGGFLKDYYDKKVYEQDPFARLDQKGVGKLVKMAVHAGRSVKPMLKMGICGEHGGEPTSIAFCHNMGLNYVSCSPFRVPIARLAAAQAAISEMDD